jgi:hypothetical protein
MCKPLPRADAFPGDPGRVRWLLRFTGMKVVLTRKLADWMDGIDVADCEVGDALDLPAAEARLLVAERWAIPDRRHDAGRPPGDVERRRPRIARGRYDEEDMERAS